MFHFKNPFHSEGLVCKHVYNKIVVFIRSYHQVFTAVENMWMHAAKGQEDMDT